MMNLDRFKKNLGLAEIPAELEKLIDFQNNVSEFEAYSQGFGVLIDYKSGMESWSSEPAFLDRLLPFAQANGSGSFYAIWKDGTEKPIGEMPIVVFGDEGGVHVIAENLRQLLALLTLDTEITVDHEEVYFYKDEEDDEFSENAEDYLHWLQENFGISRISIADSESILGKAQEKYKVRFDEWIREYYAD